MIRIVIGTALAFLATATYCLVAWYLSGLWIVLVADQEAVSMFSVYTIKPLPLSIEYAMLHWQLLALLFLVLNLICGFRQVLHSGSVNDFFPFLYCQLAWLVFAFFLHLAGGLASLVAIAHTLE